MILITDWSTQIVGQGLNRCDLTHRFLVPGSTVTGTIPNSEYPSKQSLEGRTYTPVLISCLLCLEATGLP